MTRVTKDFFKPLLVFANAKVNQIESYPHYNNVVDMGSQHNSQVKLNALNAPYFPSAAEQCEQQYIREMQQCLGDFFQSVFSQVYHYGEYAVSHAAGKDELTAAAETFVKDHLSVLDPRDIEALKHVSSVMYDYFATDDSAQFIESLYHFGWVMEQSGVSDSGDQSIDARSALRKKPTRRAENFGERLEEIALCMYASLKDFFHITKNYCVQHSASGQSVALLDQQKLKLITAAADEVIANVAIREVMSVHTINHEYRLKQYFISFLLKNIDAMYFSKGALGFEAVYRQKFDEKDPAVIQIKSILAMHGVNWYEWITPEFLAQLKHVILTKTDFQYYKQHQEKLATGLDMMIAYTQRLLRSNVVVKSKVPVNMHVVEQDVAVILDHNAHSLPVLPQRRSLSQRFFSASARGIATQSKPTFITSPSLRKIPYRIAVFLGLAAVIAGCVVSVHIAAAAALIVGGAALIAAATFKLKQRNGLLQDQQAALGKPGVTDTGNAEALTEVGYGKSAPRLMTQSAVSSHQGAIPTNRQVFSI